MYIVNRLYTYKYMLMILNIFPFFSLLSLFLFMGFRHVRPTELCKTFTLTFYKLISRGECPGTLLPSWVVSRISQKLRPAQVVREYWRIYRGLHFLTSVWFGSMPDHSPTPPPSPVSKLSLFHSLPVCRRFSLLPGKGGGHGAESFDHKKAWASINS